MYGLTTLIAFALPAVVYSRASTAVTSTAVSIQKTNVSWSLGTPTVETKISVSSVTFASIPRSTLVYTSSSGVVLVSCLYLLTTCRQTSSCYISAGYSVSCSSNPTGGLSQFAFVLTIHEMKAGDNGAVIDFPASRTWDVMGWSFAPVTVYTTGCLLLLTGAIGLTSSSVCGYNCTANFSCDASAGYVGPEVINTCTADYGVWMFPNSCTRSCSNTYFGSTATTSGNIVGSGQSQVFQCACDSSSFVSVCGADGHWNETLDTIPCWKACNASEVMFGTPINNSFLCGTQSFSCHSSLVCSPRNFTLQCNANGTWKSLVNPCTKDLVTVVAKETCNQSAIDTSCGEYCNPGNVKEVICNELFNYTCAKGAIATTTDPVYCVAANTFNWSGPLCTYISTRPTLLKFMEVTVPCQEICNNAAINSICEDSCTYGNASEVKCNDQLIYKCIGNATSVTTPPVYCIGKNLFNQSTQLCKAQVGDRSEDDELQGSNTWSPHQIIIAIAVVGVITLVAVFCYFAWKRYKRKKEPARSKECRYHKV